MKSYPKLLICAGVWLIVAPEANAPLEADPPAVAERASRTPSQDFIRRYGTSAFRVLASQLEYSPDGRFLAAAEFYHRTVCVLDAKTGETRFTCETETQSGGVVGFSPDGSELAIRDKSQVKIWQTRDGKPLRTDPMGDRRSSVYARKSVISHDRQWQALLFGQEILLTRWDQFESVHRIPFKSDFPSLAIGKGGQWVAAADARSTGARVWKAPKFDSALEWNPSKTPVQALAASPDGKTLYAACNDGSIHAWSLEQGREGSKLFQTKTNTIHSVLASPDEKHLAVGRYGAVMLCEIATGQVVHTLESIHGRYNPSLAFSPDGTTLAIGSAQQRPIELWDVKTGKLLHEPTPPIERVFATKDPRVFGSWFYGNVSLWNRETGRIVESFPLNYQPPGSRYNFGSALFHGTEQITITTQGEVYYRDLAGERSFSYLGHLPSTSPVPRAYSAQYHTATLLGLGAIRLGKTTFSRFESQPKFEQIVKASPARCLAFGFSADGKSLGAAFEDQSISIWEAETGQERHRLRLDHPPLQFLLNSNARWLAVSHADSIDVWDLTSGTRLHRLPAGKAAHRVMAFGFKEGLLATASPNEAPRIWSLKTGKEVLALKLPESIESLAFSPDDKQLAAGLNDKSIRLFDLGSKEEVHKLAGHGGAVTHLVFQPDGQRLVSASKARDLILWNLPDGKQVSARRNIGEIDDLFWAADEKTLMLKEISGRLNYIRDLEKPVMGIALHRMESPSARGFALAKNTQNLAVITSWGIRFLDVAKDREIGFLPFDRNLLFNYAEWAPDGRVLMVASGDLIGWNVVEQKEVYRITGEKLKSGPTAMTKSPDGQMVATGMSSQKVCFWDPQTGRLIREVSLARQIDLKGWSFISSVQFSADGRLLFVMARDMYFVIEVESGLVWFQKPNQNPADTSFALLADQTLLSAEPQGTARLWSWAPDLSRRDESSPERLWRGLTGNDGPTIYRSMFALADLGESTVEFLEERLPELRNPSIPAEKIASLIEDLNQPLPSVRRQASEELRELGSQARPQLEKALENDGLPAGGRSRIQILLAAQSREPDPELLAVRGVQLLEWTATPKARALLKQLANDSNDRMGTEAKASLDRLASSEE